MVMQLKDQERSVSVANIVKAIDSSSYTWRTVGSLAQETGLSASQILQAVTDDAVFRLRHGKAGKTYVTTRSKYRKEVPVLFKAYSALVNRVA